MTYTALEIIWFLILALLLGFALGWIWFGRSSKASTLGTENGTPSQSDEAKSPPQTEEK